MMVLFICGRGKQSESRMSKIFCSQEMSVVPPTHSCAILYSLCIKIAALLSFVHPDLGIGGAEFGRLRDGVL